MKIQTRPVEPMCSHSRFHLSAGWAGWIVDSGAILALAVPGRRDAEGYGPVRRLLEDGSVALIPHLIAVVLERLAERTKFRPRFVTRRARHPILSCERWKGINPGPRQW